MSITFEFLKTNDAKVWADKFVQIKKERKWTIDDIDEALMVGWFAHAMVAQEFAKE